MYTYSTQSSYTLWLPRQDLDSWRKGLKTLRPNGQGEACELRMSESIGRSILLLDLAKDMSWVRETELRALGCGHVGCDSLGTVAVSCSPSHSSTSRAADVINWKTSIALSLLWSLWWFSKEGEKSDPTLSSLFYTCLRWWSLWDSSFTLSVHPSWTKPVRTTECIRGLEKQTYARCDSLDVNNWVLFT